MTIIPDLAETFPGCPTYGFIPEPNLLVKITAREGGFERRDRKWSRFLWKYTGVPMGDQPQEDILDIYDFWLAMGAMWSGFRFKDWMDFQSCRISETPAATDQPLEASADSPANFQLLKVYTTKSGRTTQLREITRPIGSTIMIANDVGAPQTDWTLNEATGVVSIGEGFAGTPTSWGGQFDVWVRFDAQFNPTISNHEIMSVTVQLAEIRTPLA
jgi:uncharacterized protein (TIGR02217 family)